MPRRKRKPIHYFVSCLHDGTVLAAFPVRKPTPHVLKRDRDFIDSDGVCRESPTAGANLRDARNETRTRFQDIIATSLNSRRVLRELILPVLGAMRAEMSEIRKAIGRIEEQFVEKSPT